MSEHVLFGAAYYHEYQPTERLDTDLDLMAAAGFTVIRVGESVWSTWEPEEGRFDLDWMQPVLDGAHARGIAVILGTPTYAVPPWLPRLYPEITGERGTGRPIPWGARQEVDFTHPAFRFHAERIIRRVVGRYAGHPAVIGFQVDNEPGLELLHNNGVFQRFTDHLRHEYGTVENLNRQWGLVYWSHRLSTWADLWRPDGNAQPQYELAWRRFQARQTEEFIAWQAAIVREYANPDQFVTTCLAYDRPALDDHRVSRALDITAGNAYYVMQDGLALPDTRTPTQTWTTDGVWALYLSADRMYSSKQAPFLITETNASHIGFSWDSRPAYDGQWRQAAWALVARGARMIGYWHWHTLHYGTETYWGGILPHSGRPGRTYAEIARLGQEFRQAGSVVAGLTPDADMALLVDVPTRWIMQRYPALSHPDGTPDERAYQGILEPFYRGAFDAGLQTRVVHPSQLPSAAEAVRQFPILIAAGLYLTDDQMLDWLRDYAQAGGHLIIGPRTGYADQEARARTDRMPARLADAAGVWYDEFSTIHTPVEVDSDVLTLRPGAVATRWVDGLNIDGLNIETVNMDGVNIDSRNVDGVNIDGSRAGGVNIDSRKADGVNIDSRKADGVNIDDREAGGVNVDGREAAGVNIDENDVDAVTVVATYRHPHFGRWPAITTRVTGLGRITHVGTVPGQALAVALLRWAGSGRTPYGFDLPATVTCTGAVAADGGRLRFLHNWSFEPAVVTVPTDCRDVLTGKPVAAGDDLALSAWDVRVLREP